MSLVTNPARARLQAFRRVGSTNDVAKALAIDGAADGTVVLAREQSGGHGRLGRSWASPPGNLYLSLILRPDCAPGSAAELGFVAAVAAAEAVEGFLGEARRIALKWPNDLLVDGAKIGGILLESQFMAGRLSWMVLGIGINIASAPADTPYPVASIRGCGGRPVSPPRLARALLRSFLGWRQRWTAEGFAPVRAAWIGRGHRPGAMLTVSEGRRRIQGRYAGLGQDGALHLDVGGELRHVAAGEILGGTDSVAASQASNDTGILRICR